MSAFMFTGPGTCRMTQRLRHLDDAWQRLASVAGAAHDLVVKGHVVRVPKTAMGVARFSFDDLCAQPLAAADYLRIAREFHTIIVDHIQVMDHGERNEDKRVIILLETFYCLAEAYVDLGR